MLSNGVRPAGDCLGVVANPMSGRDIRRLVARASVFPNAEKANMVLRLAAAAGTLGVRRVLVSTDAFGVAAAVLRATQRRRDRDRWPELIFLELPAPTGTAADTRAAVALMRAAGAAAIVLLGGDGTVRAAAPELADVPLVALSTGTNNAFPQLAEATVAGMAAALVATGAVTDGVWRAKVLRVTAGRRTEPALVDACVSVVPHVGARALWQVEPLRELYCAFAEPHAVGLSGIAAQLLPTARTDPHGVAVRLGPGGCTVLAPIAPGVLAEVAVAEVSALPVGETRASRVAAGTVAVDGERELEFGPGTPVRVTLSADGPRVVDVHAVLRDAAERRLLVRSPVPIPGGLR